MTEAEWLGCSDPELMLEHLRGSKENRSTGGRRKLRLFGCGCGRRVWHWMSERGRTWLNLGQQCAEGLLTPDQRRQVVSQGGWQFEEPGAGVDLEAWRIERHADYAAWFTLASNVMTVATVSAHNAAGVIGIEAVPRGRSGVEHDAERAQQALLLRDIFGNPFRPVALDPAWLAWNDRTVPKLARAAYDEWQLPSGHLDPHRLAVLADALEEAGCIDTHILSHLRGPGPHVRGCWPVDLIRGIQAGPSGGG